MTERASWRERGRRLWQHLRWPFWLGLGLGLGLLVPYVWILDRRVQARFNDLVFSVPTRVYARPLPLAVGTPLNASTLKLELAFAGYQLQTGANLPGSWAELGQGRYLIDNRGYRGPGGAEPARRLQLSLAAGQISALRDAATGQPLAVAHLDPARIATVYGAHQEERQLVRLAQLPPLLVAGLQAVEDRDFKHHIGINPSAMLRAALADLKAGHTVQGGSTLTQQLVRNLFLSRSQNFSRKFNEVLMALLIEAHYSKGRILEAYVNEVFLGQQGGQAVHGFAAAAQFYFGRSLAELPPQDIAMLVGLVKGPSYYDPRRYPARALQRRQVVLDAFVYTGLLSPQQAQAATAAPLDVAAQARLPHDRFPAFMQLVRQQLGSDFDEATLRQGQLRIFTTLDPATQLYTEQALAQTMASLGRRGAAAQGAAVVTNIEDSTVLALVGSKLPADQGFNRALDAHRPIGSLIKPFVYLVALTDPAHWNLGSLLDDSPVQLSQPDGSLWTPQNDDHQLHGQVPMVDALAHSWNLATVHLGLAIGIDRVRSFLSSFGLRRVNPSPSLLLGAQDLSPFEVAGLYQYLADDGHATPLLAVSGVVDDRGQILKRYGVGSGAAQYPLAVRQIRWAMQQVVRYGTASVIDRSGLARLQAAGKTGTSDSQRDSWFAGFTGQQLAVFWMGRDDNQPTGLYGSSGSLRAWMRLFQQLPSRPLSAQLGEGLQLVWLDPASGRRIDPDCPGARQLPLVSAYVPADSQGCFWQHIGHLFDNEPAPAAGTSSND